MKQQIPASNFMWPILRSAAAIGSRRAPIASAQRLRAPAQRDERLARRGEALGNLHDSAGITAAGNAGVERAFWLPRTRYLLSLTSIFFAVIVYSIVTFAPSLSWPVTLVASSRSISHFSSLGFCTVMILSVSFTITPVT